MSPTTDDLYVRLIHSLGGALWEADLKRFRMRFADKRGETLLGYPLESWSCPDFWIGHLHPADRTRALEMLLNDHLEEHGLFEFEYRMIAADGRTVWIRDVSIVDVESRNLIGVMLDVTDQKLRMQEAQNHIWYLESLDQVNRAIQSSSDLECMIQSVLAIVLKIFDSDRAWLVYPCDPSQKSCQSVREQTKPEWVVSQHLGEEVSTDEADVKHVLRVVRECNGPVGFGPSLEHPLPTLLNRRFAVQSQLAVAIYPNCDLPYMFGLHHCSQARVWATHERRLLQDIGHRLADALGAQIAYRQLRDSESRFRIFVDHAMDAFLLHDADGTILDANRQACESLGYAIEELIGKNPNEFDVGLRREELDRFKVLLPTKLVHTFESRQQRKDGSTFPVEVSIRPFLEGGNYRAISLSRDITNREVSEQALRTSERRLDAAQKMAHVAWWERDFETGRACRSPESYSIFGLSEGQGEELPIWDQQWRERIHPDDLERTTEAFQIAIAGGRRYDLEYRIVRPSGEIRFVHSQADVSFDAEGRALRIFGTMQDITELRQVERELRSSEARFRTLVDHAADAFFLLDATGTVVDVNRQACESLGFLQEELIGRRPHEFDPRTSPAEVEELMVRLGNGEILAFESEHRRKDGSVFPVDIRIRPFWEGSERLAVALVRNITDRKRLEEQFRQSQKMEAVGQLAGGVAHDFNNLLTVINSYSEILSTSLPAGDPHRELAGEVLKAGERAATLTRQLLAFSRKQILQPQTICLNWILNDLAKLLRRLIGENIELLLDVEPNLGAVRIDPGQFEQAIINMALNARDAMPNGGKIVLATTNVELGDSNINNLPPGPYVMVAMSDTGQGMDEATKSRIFEPFYTTKAQGKGTGLGLAMVYGFVNQSNGYVEVDSELGAGTTMRVYLPRITVSSPVMQATLHPHFTMPNGSETILLVEDEEAVRTLFRNTLSSCGYKVLDARDGAEGLTIASQYPHAIDLLVTDLIMPRMGGKQLSEEVVKIRPNMRTLFLSGYSEDDGFNQAAELGVQFLQKPFSAMNLTRKVRETLDSTPRCERS